MKTIKCARNTKNITASSSTSSIKMATREPTQQLKKSKLYSKIETEVIRWLCKTVSTIKSRIASKDSGHVLLFCGCKNNKWRSCQLTRESKANRSLQMNFWVQNSITSKWTAMPYFALATKNLVIRTTFSGWSTRGAPSTTTKDSFIWNTTLNHLNTT